MRVLVVEDETDIANLIKRALERDGEIRAEVVGSGTAALKSATEAPPDLILLDLNLPFPDGIEVFRILRGRPQTADIPVIMVTARTSEADRVAGIELGAEDYVTKPFSTRELVARVRATLARKQRTVEKQEPTVYEGEHLRIDFDAVSIRVDDSPVRLTRREFELLRFLVENPNRVVSRDRLLERVWGFDRQIETRSVDVHIGRLRQKLGAASRQIETVIGLGYRFTESPE